jgi:hypothetical protein
VLEIKEWTPLEPIFFEKKYYVRGVGPLGNPRDLALIDVKCKAQLREGCPSLGRRKQTPTSMRVRGKP